MPSETGGESLGLAYGSAVQSGQPNRLEETDEPEAGGSRQASLLGETEGVRAPLQR